MVAHVSSWLDRPGGEGRGWPAVIPPGRARGAVDRGRRLVAATLAVGALGCGGGSDLPLAEVRGVVTYKGKPLEKGDVVFAPQEGTPGPQATGEIASDGSYRLMTNDDYGAAIGTHKVTVASRAEQSEADYKSLKIPKLITPTKYANEQRDPAHLRRQGGRTTSSTSTCSIDPLPRAGASLGCLWASGPMARS